MLRGEQVAGPHQWWSRFRASLPSKPKPRDPLEGDEIQDFWGQLWFVPNSNPRVRFREERDKDLVWIHRDLWLAKSFEPADCFLIGEGDKWDQTLAKLSFVEDI